MERVIKEHTISSKIHDENPPLDSPLLNDNNRASPLLLRNLNQVHGDLRRRDTNTDAVDESTSDQHTDTVTPGLDGRSQQPPEASKSDGIAPSDAIGHWTRHYGANDGAASESGSDATLRRAGRVVEVLHVLSRSDDGGDGGDVETEAGEYDYERGF